MSITEDQSTLPSSKDLVKIKYGVYKEILKRYNSYSNFAKKFNKKTMYKERNFWSDINNFFNIFDHMITTYDKILTQKENNTFSLNDTELIGGIYSQVVSLHGGIIESKLKYFIDKEYIPSIEIRYIKNVIENKGRNIKGKVKPEHQLLAKQILEKYNKQQSA